MEWEAIDLSIYKVAGAKFGGPVALMRDTSKPLKVGQVALPNDKIFVYTSGGNKIADFAPEGHLVGMGWTDTEQLVCVQMDGNVFVYDIHGEYSFQFSTGRTVREQGVKECSIWGTGLVILTQQHKLFWVTNFTERKTVEMPDPSMDEPPTCMTVIEPALTETQTPEVLLGSPDGAILVVTTEGCSDQEISVSKGPYKQMVCSADGKYLACFSAAVRHNVLPQQHCRVVPKVALNNALCHRDQ
jgi:hypothetical protein